MQALWRWHNAAAGCESAPCTVPDVPLGTEVGSGPALPPQHTESERTVQKMGRGRASVGEILCVCYLSELRPLVALIKSDVYWV